MKNKNESKDEVSFLDKIKSKKIVQTSSDQLDINSRKLIRTSVSLHRLKSIPSEPSLKH